MKKYNYLIALILLGILAWYFFIKPYDYLVRFEIKTSPGTLLKEAEDWNLVNEKKEVFTYIINNKNPFESLNEVIETDDLKLNLDWNFESINDTITLVKVGITEEEHSIYNRITAPFINTTFKKKTINLIQSYKEEIEFKLREKFNVKYFGIDTIAEQQYVYIELKNVNMLDKAAKMIDANQDFMEFLNNHNMNGGTFPFLIVDRWDLVTNTIDFRYCFPVKNLDSLPVNTKYKYDLLSSKKSLKAIYNGNYMTSDRGWFALQEYAKRHNIPIDLNPIEIFKNSPFDGGDELKWKAEIYMPIKTN
jgi:effector-binding domain-containing protein